MSFGESIFSVGLFQKTSKEDQEGNRRHHIMAGPERLPSGANRPHHGAARSAMVASTFQLLEASSTIS
jgi:hypothetical protein